MEFYGSKIFLNSIIWTPCLLSQCPILKSERLLQCYFLVLVFAILNPQGKRYAAPVAILIPLRKGDSDLELRAVCFSVVVLGKKQTISTIKGKIQHQK